MSTVDPILYHVILSVERSAGWERLIESIQRTVQKPILPEFKADDEFDCAICQDKIEKGQMMTRLPCTETINHIFHSECIDKWFDRKNTCPICRSIITGYEEE